MKGEFVKLWRKMGVKGNPEEAFDFLNRLYSNPNRYYHNLNHIKSCLDELNYAKEEGIGKNLNAVEFATWYHDAIYDTKSKKNEEESALLAYHTCQEAELPLIFAQNVHDLVLVTKHNTTPKNIDEEIITDIDLAIFGKPLREFEKYEEGIRKEYLWVPKDKFKEGRSKILQGFLDRPTIYCTSFFRERYEKQARINLKNSIEKLMS